MARRRSGYMGVPRLIQWESGGGEQSARGCIRYPERDAVVMFIKIGDKLFNRDRIAAVFFDQKGASILIETRWVDINEDEAAALRDFLEETQAMEVDLFAERGSPNESGRTPVDPRTHPEKRTVSYDPE
jgi:hypothetical protein